MELMEPMVKMAPKDHKVLLVMMEQMVLMDKMEPMVKMVPKDLKDLQDFKE